MKALMLAAGAAMKFATSWRGSMDWSGTVNTTFVVPDGVYSLCLGIVGRGQSALSTSQSGKGGNFRYLNDIPVKPGDTFTVVIGANGSAFGKYTSELALGTFGLLGEDGMPGRSIPGGQTATPGGDAGGTKKGWNGYGLNLKTGAMSQGAATGFAYNGADFGGGGGADRRWSSTYPGGKGQVRVMWGADRAFPSTGLVD